MTARRTPPGLRFEDHRAVGYDEWLGLVRAERAPFGEVALDLVHRPKDRTVRAVGDDGTLLGSVGACVATVEVEGHGTFEVVGIGGLYVHPSARQGGVGRELMDRIRALARTLGPDVAMIFCREELVALYASRGYERITDEVVVDQPGGAVTSPLAAMWMALRPWSWPPGRVRLHGEPF